MSKGNGITKKLDLSDDMAVFMGKDKASRAEIIKACWKHIKKYDLQDPKARRTIVPDAALTVLFGSRPFSMFQLTGKISDHVS